MSTVYSDFDSESEYGGRQRTSSIRSVEDTSRSSQGQAAKVDSLVTKVTETRDKMRKEAEVMMSTAEEVRV